MNATIQQTNTRTKSVKNPGLDPVLIGLYLTLIAIGMIAVYSATIAKAYEIGDPFIFLRKILFHISLAILALLVTSQIPVEIWRKWARISMVGGLALLCLVLVPGLGHEYNNSTRWVKLGGWVFQPSEFARIGFLIFVASYVSDRRNKLDSLVKDMGPLIGVFSLYALLLLLEPDYGSTVILGGALIAMLYLNGLKGTHIALFVALAFIAAVAGVVQEAYRLERVMTFLKPWDDPYGSTYQLGSSLIALGRGEWFGVGLGTSVLKLFYLPYAGSDFLLAVIGEEFGFLGTCAIIGLFVALVWKIFRISWLAASVGDVFSCNLAQAIGFVIGISAAINMGVNMGALPTKGLTLPFLSGGGSSLVAYSIALGMVLSIQRQSSRSASE